MISCHSSATSKADPYEPSQQLRTMRPPRWASKSGNRPNLYLATISASSQWKLRLVDVHLAIVVSEFGYGLGVQPLTVQTEHIWLPNWVSATQAAWDFNYVLNTGLVGFRINALTTCKRRLARPNTGQDLDVHYVLPPLLWVVSVVTQVIPCIKI